MDYEAEVREAVFKHRNDVNQTLSKYHGDMSTQEVFALMLSSVLNALEDGLIVLTRQIESLRGFDAEQ